MAITKFLSIRNIAHQRQFRITECKNQRPLPFDFAVFDKFHRLKFLIEYNGRQHYELCSGFYDDQEDLDYRQNNDKIKKDFCKKYKIPLIIIPYNEFKNIDQILENFICLL